MDMSVHGVNPNLREVGEFEKNQSSSPHHELNTIIQILILMV